MKKKDWTRGNGKKQGKQMEKEVGGKGRVKAKLEEITNPPHPLTFPMKNEASI